MFCTITSSLHQIQIGSWLISDWYFCDSLRYFWCIFLLDLRAFAEISCKTVFCIVITRILIFNDTVLSYLCLSFLQFLYQHANIFGNLIPYFYVVVDASFCYYLSLLILLLLNCIIRANILHPIFKGLLPLYFLIFFLNPNNILNSWIHLILSIKLQKRKISSLRYPFFASPHIDIIFAHRIIPSWILRWTRLIHMKRDWRFNSL
jgi:hypothetical protein